MRPVNDISPHIPECPGSRGCKRIDVEPGIDRLPSCHRLRISGHVRIPDHADGVRGSPANRRESIAVVHQHVWGEGATTLSNEFYKEIPAADGFIQSLALIQKFPALAKRKIVSPTSFEHMPDIEIRRTVVRHGV